VGHGSAKNLKRVPRSPQLAIKVPRGSVTGLPSAHLRTKEMGTAKEHPFILSPAANDGTVDA